MGFRVVYPVTVLNGDHNRVPGVCMDFRVVYPVTVLNGGSQQSTGCMYGFEGSVPSN